MSDDLQQQLPDSHSVDAVKFRLWAETAHPKRASASPDEIGSSLDTDPLQQLQAWVVTSTYTSPPLLGSGEPKAHTTARIVEAINEDAAAWEFTRRCSVWQLQHENVITVQPIDAPAARYFAQYDQGDPAKRLVVTADERREVHRA